MMETLLDVGLYINILDRLSNPILEEKSGDGTLNKKRFGKKFLEDEDIKGPGNLHHTFCLIY